MEKLISVVCFVFVLGAIECQNPGDHCFHFLGDGFIHFNLEGFVNNQQIHFSFEFKTTQNHGVLMHSRGQTGDLETLYVRNGRLHYMLYNPAASGVEGTFGAHFSSTERVNTGDWVQVHLYRSWPEADSKGRMRPRTGFTYKIGDLGQTRARGDYRPRVGIDLDSTVYFGGYWSSLSSVVGRLNGEIRRIREDYNDSTFDQPTLNFSGRVVDCEDDALVDGPGPV